MAWRKQTWEKLRNSSVHRKREISENQSNIDVFLKDLKKGGKKNGKSDAV